MFRRGAIEAYFKIAGLPVFPYLNELQKLEKMDAERYRAHISKKLDDAIGAAVSDVPYYREKLCAAKPVTIENFGVLDKADVWENFDRLISGELAREKATTIYTSGSTGRRAKVLFDKTDRVSRLALQWYGECMPGSPDESQIPVFSGAAYIWGASDLRKGFVAGLRNRTRDFLIGQRIFPSHTLTKEKVADFHSQILSMKPRIIVGYVSQLRIFAEIASEMGLAKITVDKIVPTAEQLDAVSERAISDFFDAPVRQRYGSRDAGPIAQQCEYGSWHIFSMRVYPEVLRDDGTIADSGEGRLLLTTLDNRVMPLIRYDIEDRVTLAGESAAKCKCGRPFPVMDAIHGRELDCIKLPDGGTLSGLAVAEALRWMPVTEFVFVQESAASGTLYFAARPELSDEMLGEARSKLEAQLGEEFRLTMTQVEKVPRELYDPTGTGKRRQVVSAAK